MLRIVYSNHSCVSLGKTETLETILCGPRNNSGFYPEPDSRVGKEVVNKQGNMPDSLHGKSLNSGISSNQIQHCTVTIFILYVVKLAEN